MIDVNNVTKRYGKDTVVNNLSFSVKPGSITGFLGPNGSGKSTTMRIILGLDHPSEGEATINGHHYRDISNPLTTVGALLDASAVHPKRTARQHLDVICVSNNIDRSRVSECLDIVGLSSVANKNAGAFSLGMKQRLGIAAALLGDPDYLIFDEPNNGLDPEGIHWMREFAVQLAKNGKGVLISSHQISELSRIADDLVVIGHGTLISYGTMDEFTLGAASKVDVSSPHINELVDALHTRFNDVTVSSTPRGALIENIAAESIGAVANELDIPLSQLTTRNSLEEAFLDATKHVQEFDTREVGHA